MGLHGLGFNNSWGDLSMEYLSVEFDDIDVFLQNYGISDTDVSELPLFHSNSRYGDDYVISCGYMFDEIWSRCCQVVF